MAVTCVTKKGGKMLTWVTSTGLHLVEPLKLALSSMKLAKIIVSNQRFMYDTGTYICTYAMRYFSSDIISMISLREDIITLSVHYHFFFIYQVYTVVDCAQALFTKSRVRLLHHDWPWHETLFCRREIIREPFSARAPFTREKCRLNIATDMS